jgi:hypothetical protein
MRPISVKFVILSSVLLNWKEFISAKGVKSLYAISVEKIRKKSSIKRENGLKNLIESAICADKTSLKFTRPYKNSTCIGQSKLKCLKNGSPI